jgi:hypothetical protein
MRARFVVVIGAVLAGCAYKAASKTTEPNEHRVDRSTVGCLEVGVDRRSDLGDAAVVRYAFANHCEGAAQIDVAWASVIGRTAEGAELALVPTKRAKEVVVAPNGEAETTLVYPAPAAIGQLCVDVASLAQETPARWRCFGNPEAVALR